MAGNDTNHPLLSVLDAISVVEVCNVSMNNDYLMLYVIESSHISF